MVQKIDDKGKEVKEFLFHFIHYGRRIGFSLLAHSQSEANAMAHSLRMSAEADGELIATVDAPNIPYRAFVGVPYGKGQPIPMIQR